MTIRYGTFADPVYAGAGQTGLQCARCTYTGIVASGDTVVFGDTTLGAAPINNDYQNVIPQGAVMVDAIVRTSDGGSTFSLAAGYAAADGAASTTNSVSDVDATYFLTTDALSASGIVRANGPVTPVTLQRPTNPTITFSAGDAGSTFTLELDVFYIYHGNTGANTVEDA